MRKKPEYQLGQRLLYTEKDTNIEKVGTITSITIEINVAGTKTTYFSDFASFDESQIIAPVNIPKKRMRTRKKTDFVKHEKSQPLEQPQINGAV
jgi:hypothetical protein